MGIYVFHFGLPVRVILRAQCFEKVVKSGAKLTKSRVKLSKSGVKLVKTDEKWDVFWGEVLRGI